MKQSNEELLFYIITSERVSDNLMISYIKNGALTIDTILGKLSLFMQYLRRSKEMAKALLPKLKEYQLVRSGRSISIDQLADFLTLAKEISYHEQDVELCVLNIVFQVKESSQSKPSLQKFCREWANKIMNDESKPNLLKALIALIYEQVWERQIDSNEEVENFCECML